MRTGAAAKENPGFPLGISRGGINVRKGLLSLSSQQQAAQSQKAQRGRCGFRNHFIADHYLGDVVFRNLCSGRLYFLVADELQITQVQVDIASLLGIFKGSKFNGSAPGKLTHIQCAEEGDGSSIGPEVGEIRGNPGTVFFRRKNAEVHCKVALQSEGVAGFKHQLGILFHFEQINIDISRSCPRGTKQGASRPYSNYAGFPEIGLGGGPGDRSGIFSDDGFIPAALREIAVRRAIYRPVVGVSINSVSCRSAPDIDGSLGKTRGKAA